LKHISTKITAFILIATFICACSSIKRVPEDKFLLAKNEVFENNKVVSNEIILNQLYQKPNSKVFGVPFGLFFYNLANPNPDSTYQAKFKNNPGKYERMSKWLSAKQVDQLGKSFWYHGIHDFLKKTGEAPVIFDKSKTDKSVLRLKYYYFNQGYFDVKAAYSLDSFAVKKIKTKYAIHLGNPYFIDSLKTSIATPALDSLYKTAKIPSFIETRKQYKTEDFEKEKNRITTHFRNNGVYYFQPNNITFDIDTINKKNKTDINLKISNYSYLENDSTKTTPFKIYKISDVNIFTDYAAGESNVTIKDSTTYNSFNLFSKTKLKYKPYAITDAVFITKGGVFSDVKTTLTTRSLNNLKIFNYPSILYEVDKRDATQSSLIAKIYLTPRKKYGFGTSMDVTHSNIQNIGINFSPSISIRNVFNGAETLEFSGRANMGSSKDFANPNDVFFNASEYGLDLKLNFPRILMPFGTEKIVPKSMFPSTLITSGYSIQKNIGLDKENFTGAVTYNWTPKKDNTARFELLNIQFVRNLNSQNYFNVYKSSYNVLNNLSKKPNYNIEPKYFDSQGNLTIEDGTDRFMYYVLSQTDPNTTADFETVKSIAERQFRLTENDFILATSFSYTKTTKKDLTDSNFYLFRTKIESAGSLLSLFAKGTKMRKNSSDKFEIFNLAYSEYIKTEFDFIKLWDLQREKVLAVRTFFGIAIPFGNSNNIPFSRSYYAGGSNDNRGWNPYSLGPGRTGGTNDFNEANMKIALSTEFRFKILGSIKGALFVDAGNIWNAWDDMEDKRAQFTGIKSLEDIAVGSGFGLRYDLGFFVIRFDLGFKTYNPAYEKEKRWFKDYNFSRSVLNFGINYPF
jgi:outer membrane protein assembly factor BamA